MRTRRILRAELAAVVLLGAWLGGCQSEATRPGEDPRATWDPRDAAPYNHINWDDREWDGYDWGRSRTSGH